MRLAGYIRKRWHPLHRLRKQAWFIRALPWFDVPILARVGFRRPIYLRLITHSPFYLLGYRMGSRAFDVFEALIHDLPRDGCFYDIGSNIGVYSFAACEWRPDITVLSVEPDPDLVKLLNRTSKRWGLKRHRVLPAAASDVGGETLFEIDRSTSATGQIAGKEGESFQQRHFGVLGQRITVRTVSVDELAERFPSPGLVKVDVEGHEDAVFEGAIATLAARRPTWIFESFAPKNRQMRLRLEGLDYLLWDVDRPGRVTDETTNFLAIHPDRLSVVLRKRLNELGIAV